MNPNPDLDCNSEANLDLDPEYVYTEQTFISFSGSEYRDDLWI